MSKKKQRKHFFARATDTSVDTSIEPEDALERSEFESIRIAVHWTDEADAFLRTLRQKTALAIMADVALAARMLVSGAVTDKVRHMALTRSEDPRLRIECGHYRALAILDDNVLTVTEVLYRNEQTYQRIWRWQTVKRTQQPRQPF